MQEIDGFGIYGTFDVVYPKKITSFESLKALVSGLSVMAEVEVKTPKMALVRVFNNTGTSMYLAKAAGELMWLGTIASKQEAKGTCTIYHVPLKK